MKVYIGNYVNYFRPFQLAELLRNVGVSADRRYTIGEWLSTTFVDTLLNWIYQKRKRTVKVKIHSYDRYNVDSTLAMIIHPMLVSLTEKRFSSGFVDDDDVPDNIKRTSAPKPNNDDIDDNFEARWVWIINEMIWAFSQINLDWEIEFHRFGENFDKEGYIKHQARISNGTRLFGKYYQNLWT